MTHKQYGTVIVHKDSQRTSSVNSWATRSTAAPYQSSSSYSSDTSYPSEASYNERDYRDPFAENHIVEVKQRRNHQGQIVSVTNYHQRNNEYYEPTPNYDSAAGYKPAHKNKSKG